MNGQHCTTDQYGNTGCITTAVHSGGGLPMTGLDIGQVTGIGIILLLLGILIYLALIPVEDKWDA